MFQMPRNPFSRLNEPWIFSRTACLGNEVFSQLGSKVMRFNIQKGRIDLINSKLLGDFSLSPKSRTSFFVDKEIAKIVEQQRGLDWLEFRPPKLILVDSFSDLTDQEFQWRKANHFYANFGDVKKELVNQKLINLGLIEEEKLFSLYEEFISQVNQKWGIVPILYLHYPTYKETRKLYLDRSRKLREVTFCLASQNPNFHVLDCERQFVDFEEDSFPYHYHSSVYTTFVKSIKSLLLKEGILDEI